MANELDRILAVPVWEPDIDAVQSKWSEAVTVVGSDARLRAEQALTLEAVSEYGGAMIAIGVGGGKTLAAFLAALAAGVEASEVLILCPAPVIPQYYTEFEKYRGWGFLVGDTPPPIASYSKLSRTDELTDLTGGRPPRIIIADEAHMLSNARSKAQRAGRTKKFLRYLDAFPDCKFVAMSATLTTTSVYDYAHLAARALGDASPLPTSHSRLEAWARILDSSRASEPPLSEDWWKIGALMDDPRFAAPPEITSAVERARWAYQRRVVTTPGVVRSTEQSCDQPITFRALADDIPEISAVRSRVEADWMLPNGEEIDDPLQAYSKLRQISQGFYYEAVWNGPIDYEWLSARSEYGREITRVLRDNRRGLDTPGQVAAECAAGRPYDGAMLEAWAEWEAVRDRPGPDSVPVWFSDAPAEAMLASARSDVGRRVIVWYSHRAVAARLEAVHGLKVVWPGMPVDPEGPDVVGLSVWSHSTGLNLQSYDTHAVLCPMSNGAAWEQLIGRIHRAGRDAPVLVIAASHTSELKKALTSARSDAKYIEETQGLSQRLLTMKTEEEP